MAKKTLEEKIKDVIFWMVIFFFLYLIVGYLMQSEYLHSALNWDESYNLLRDALTITAYFLAPATAFVLFSDWREQHVEIENEKISKEIVLGILPIIEKSTSDFFQFRGDPDGLLKFREHYFNSLYELRNKVRQVRGINSRSLEFIRNGDELAQRLITGFSLMDAYLNADSNYNWAIEFSTPDQSQIKDLIDRSKQAVNDLTAKNEEIRQLIKRLNVLSVGHD